MLRGDLVCLQTLYPHAHIQSFKTQELPEGVKFLRRQLRADRNQLLYTEMSRLSQSSRWRLAPPKKETGGCAHIDHWQV